MFAVSFAKRFDGFLIFATVAGFEIPPPNYEAPASPGSQHFKAEFDLECD